jgi:hypothetical protein
LASTATPVGICDHVDHALDGLGLAASKDLTLPPKRGEMGHHRHQHAGQVHVLGELGLPLVLAKLSLRGRACR